MANPTQRNATRPPPRGSRRRLQSWATAMALVAGGTAGGACRPPPPPQPFPTETFTDDGLGVTLELPPHWLHSRHGTSHIFSGPADDPSYYTTITLQGLPKEATLDEALARAFAPLADRTTLHWQPHEPAMVDGHAALRYALHFELHETMRRKAGVLVDASDAFVDLSYAATDELFPLSVAAFDHSVRHAIFH